MERLCASLPFYLKSRPLNYLILEHPGHNRVYYQASSRLNRSEFNAALGNFSLKPKEVETIDLKGLRYLSFAMEAPLSDKDLRLISQLSFAFGLFEAQNSKLSPIALKANAFIDPKISTLLKYTGKTNERFTRLMINVALHTSDFFDLENLRLLDPIAGKGTTLFEAAVLGLNGIGIERDQKSVHEGLVFFKRYLEQERYKHLLEKKRVSGKTKSEAIFLSEFQYASDKTQFKTEALKRSLGFICGNTENTAEYLKSNSVHLMVGDLPYGIQHGSRSGKFKQSRSVSNLIKGAAEAWYTVLKKGGCLVLAYNEKMDKKTDLLTLLQNVGFKVPPENKAIDFSHKVDHSILRDLLVLKK